MTGEGATHLVNTSQKDFMDSKNRTSVCSVILLSLALELVLSWSCILLTWCLMWSACIVKRRHHQRITDQTYGRGGLEESQGSLVLLLSCFCVLGLFLWSLLFIGEWRLGFLGWEGSFFLFLFHFILWSDYCTASFLSQSYTYRNICSSLLINMSSIH